MQRKINWKSIKKEVKKRIAEKEEKRDKDKN